MKPIALVALLGALSLTTACSTTTEAVSLPFDIASTSGEASSSSSGDDEKPSSADTLQLQYVRSQMQWIQRDAARGHGESLAALAQLLDESDSAAFALWTHQNYAMLFDDLQQPADLLSRIQQHRTLSN